MNSVPLISSITLTLVNLAATRWLAKLLLKLSPLPMTFCLAGELGTGKTQLAKYLASQFGCQSTLISTSFQKAQLYYNQQQAKLLHIDSYYLTTQQTLTLINDYHNLTLTVIEWANLELFKTFLPAAVWLELTYLNQPNQRQLKLTGPTNWITKVRLAYAANWQ